MRTMFGESHDEEQIISGVAALDIGKAELVCCVRVPAENGSGKRLQEVVARQGDGTGLSWV
jgi:transposase